MECPHQGSGLIFTDGPTLKYHMSSPHVSNELITTLDNIWINGLQVSYFMNTWMVDMLLKTPTYADNKGMHHQM